MLACADLTRGAVESIPVQHIDRVRGENNAILQRMRDACDCRIMIGENGRAWIEGSSEGIAWARKAIQQLVQEGHSKGFETILNEMENKTKGDA